METFPQHQQLQKNVLLTICSDRILQDVNFDKYRCAKLVLDCLCLWDDSSMNRYGFNSSKNPESHLGASGIR